MNNVTIANFEQDVIAASMSVPVLVDFWAPWCGPCKTIGPILEKLEADYQGRFQLVKIDSDQEQELAQAFGIRSIPTCILMMQGKPVDGFQGAIPESQVKAFLDKHLPPAPEPEPEVAQAPEEAALSPEERLDAMRLALTNAPDDDKARLVYLKALLSNGSNGHLALAQQAFAPVAQKVGIVSGFDTIARWLSALEFAKTHSDTNAALALADAAIASNKRDFSARFQRAQLLIATHAYTEAMDELLEILMRDKSWEDGLARKTFVAVLDIIEPPVVTVEPGKIPPQDPTVTTYRRRLSSVVLS